MQRIYCGGRFPFDYTKENYLAEASQDYRSILLGDVNKLLRGKGVIKISDQLAYIGPYYFETDGMLDQDIVKKEMQMIEMCDHAYFLLDSALCPGTISEMVYAATLHKKLCIVYIRDESETESSLRSACWYPILQCQQINPSGVNITSCESYEQAKEFIIIEIERSCCDY